MENLPIKFSTYFKALPPQPVRLVNQPWGAGEPTSGPMVPFILAAKYGVELIYPHDTECHVIGAHDTIQYDWDFAKEPGVTGGEFRSFSPVHASQFYLFNTRLDLEPPPGYVLRIEPHPRYFTDTTETVPLAMIAHLQNEWYPRLLFVVFRAPPQGQRHIFRKGEPFAQVLFVPQNMKREKTRANQDHAEPAQSQHKKLTRLPIRMTNVTWAGAATQKMEDGSEPQPWHCLPFIEGSTYGMELFYPFDADVTISHAGSAIHFEGQAGVFTTSDNPLFYRLNADLNLDAPAGYVCRIEPHPRYFTDNTGTAPLPLSAHLSGEEGIVFRSPRIGERHVFRKGEPFGQVIFVPEPVRYAISRMSLEDSAQRRELEESIDSHKAEIADHVWRNPAGSPFNNHYKVLARAFARDGLPGVKEVVQKAVEARERAIPSNLTIPEYMALGLQRMREQKFEQAEQLFTDILSRDPNNARAHSAVGICYDNLGNIMQALRSMQQAVTLQPGSANFHANLGELLRRLGRWKEAEASFRSALAISPSDAEVMYALGLILTQQGRQAEAMQSYRAAISTGTPIPQAHVALGMILAKQGQAAEARACFEAALAVAPNFAAAKQSLQDLDKRP